MNATCINPSKVSIFSQFTFLCQMNHWTRMSLLGQSLFLCQPKTIEGKCYFRLVFIFVSLEPLNADVTFFGWLPPPTAEQSLRRRIWRKRKEAKRDEIRNQGWNQEPSVRDLLDDLVTLGPWKWAVGGGRLVWDKESTKRILSWDYGRIDDQLELTFGWWLRFVDFNCFFHRFNVLCLIRGAGDKDDSFKIVPSKMQSVSSRCEKRNQKKDFVTRKAFASSLTKIAFYWEQTIAFMAASDWNRI